MKILVATDVQAVALQADPPKDTLVVTPSTSVSKVRGGTFTYIELAPEVQLSILGRPMLEALARATEAWRRSPEGDNAMGRSNSTWLEAALCREKPKGRTTVVCGTQTVMRDAILSNKYPHSALFVLGTCEELTGIVLGEIHLLVSHAWLANRPEFSALLLSQSRAWRTAQGEADQKALAEIENRQAVEQSLRIAARGKAPANGENKHARIIVCSLSEVEWRMHENPHCVVVTPNYLGAVDLVKFAGQVDEVIIHTDEKIPPALATALHEAIAIASKRAEGALQNLNDARARLLLTSTPSSPL